MANWNGTPDTEEFYNLVDVISDRAYRHYRLNTKCKKRFKYVGR